MKHNKKNIPTKPNNGGGIVAASIKHVTHSGPIPDPETLRRYNEVLPGTAEKIIDAFERQNKHRISIEEKAVNHGIYIEKVGQFFAFLITITALCGSLGLIFIGKSIEGIAGVIVAIAGLVASFIYKNKKD